MHHRDMMATSEGLPYAFTASSSQAGVLYYPNDNYAWMNIYICMCSCALYREEELIWHFTAEILRLCWPAKFNGGYKTRSPAHPTFSYARKQGGARSCTPPISLLTTQTYTSIAVLDTLKSECQHIINKVSYIFLSNLQNFMLLPQRKNTPTLAPNILLTYLDNIKITKNKTKVLNRSLRLHCYKWT